MMESLNISINTALLNHFHYPAMQQIVDSYNKVSHLAAL